MTYGPAHLQKQPPHYKVDFVGPTQPIWYRFKFPSMDISLHGEGERWIAATRPMWRPLCWTPTKRFWFGGKEFIPLYPCAAWATANFGWVAQKLWDRTVLEQS